MIQVIHRALDIIEFIRENEKRELSLKEIANKLNLNHSTCSNILKTLTERDYLYKSNTTKCYSLGRKLTKNDDIENVVAQIITVAKEPIHELSKKINESCILAMVQQATRVILLEVKVENELVAINKREKPAYQTSTGRLVLAFLTELQRNEFINKYGLPEKEDWEDVYDKESLFIELDRIKKKGMAIQVNKSFVLGIGVPIIANGKVIASLGVYLPEVRFLATNKDVILGAIQETALLINSKIKKSSNNNTIELLAS